MNTVLINTLFLYVIKLDIKFLYQFRNCVRFSNAKNMQNKLLCVLIKLQTIKYAPVLLWCTKYINKLDIQQAT